jgi:hypothetical protein
MAVTAALASIVVVQVAGGMPAEGAGSTRWLSMDAATFESRDETTHWAENCPPSTNPDDVEDRGTVNGGAGYVGSVVLPQGATIKRFLLSVRDDGKSLDAHAYLVRKRMAPAPGLDGLDGYKVLAHVVSSGASPLLRRFEDGTVQSAHVNNGLYSYFAEIVNCGDVVQPIGVQVVYEP